MAVSDQPSKSGIHQSQAIWAYLSRFKKHVEDVGDLIAKQLEQTGKTKQLEQSERNTGKLKQSLVAHGLSDEIEIMMTSKLNLRLRYFCNECTDFTRTHLQKIL